MNCFCIPNNTEPNPKVTNPKVPDSVINNFQFMEKIDECKGCRSTLHKFRIFPCCRRYMCYPCISLHFYNSNKCPFCKKDIYKFI